ncbi:protein shisa-5 isoform X1 [Hermetia illucens]|uniref:protein shisa-5 isoform X1 n=1 Tax=Hermetia illucens TaxID=343691 RepID=UPI0018CC4BB7|nr:protein shisa-5 isoform X1 [Hermetia illucens]
MLVKCIVIFCAFSAVCGAINNDELENIRQQANSFWTTSTIAPVIIGKLIVVGLCLCCLVLCKACLRCCTSDNQGAVLIESAPVIVTSTTTTTGPGGYPITVQGTPGGGLQATPYPTTTHMPMPQPQMPVNPPYPTHGGAMPQPYIGTQGYPSNPPYPPMNDPSRMNPPSYDQVVSSEATQKQAPYNPNYMGN